MLSFLTFYRNFDTNTPLCIASFTFCFVCTFFQKKRKLMLVCVTVVNINHQSIIERRYYDQIYSKLNETHTYIYTLSFSVSFRFERLLTKTTVVLTMSRLLKLNFLSMLGICLQKPSTYGL